MATVDPRIVRLENEVRALKQQVTMLQKAIAGSWAHNNQMSRRMRTVKANALNAQASQSRPNGEL